MKSFSYKRVLSPFLLALAVGSMLNCGGGGGDEQSFTSHGDALVMTSLVGTWKGTSAAGKPYTLTLCEDLDPNAQGHSLAETCGTLHQIEGSGRGKTETVTMDPGGCGGCDYDNSAYMVGTLEGSDMASTPIYAQFSMDGDANGPPLPYTFALADSDYMTNENQRQTTTMTGTEATAGSIDVSIFRYTPLPDVTPLPPYDAGNGSDASQGSDAAQDNDGGDLDSGDLDATALDASADDASASDSGSIVPAPTATSSSSPAPTTSASSGIPRQISQTTTIRLVRVADAACPSP